MVEMVEDKCAVVGEIAGDEDGEKDSPLQGAFAGAAFLCQGLCCSATWKCKS